MAMGVTLMWSGTEPSPNSYAIFRSTTSGGQKYSGTPLAIVAGNVRTYSDFTVVPGQGYYYTVVAINKIGGATLPSAPSPETYQLVPDVPTAISSLSSQLVSQ